MFLRQIFAKNAINDPKTFFKRFEAFLKEIGQKENSENHG